MPPVSSFPRRHGAGPDQPRYTTPGPAAGDEAMHPRSSVCQSGVPSRVRAACTTPACVPNTSAPSATTGGISISARPGTRYTTLNGGRRPEVTKRVRAGVAPQSGQAAVGCTLSRCARTRSGVSVAKARRSPVLEAARGGAASAT
jgi:hypothetical protein